jgi:hypothetical protein
MAAQTISTNESDLRFKACEYLRAKGEHGTAMLEIHTRCGMTGVEN